MKHLFFYLERFLDSGWKYRKIPSRLISAPYSLLVGFFLGIFKQKDLKWIDKRFYNQVEEYLSDSYNKQAFDWEERVVSEYFTGLKTTMIIAVGCGREAYFMHNRGFEVHAYECNQRFREFGDGFFKREGISLQIKDVERDSFPNTDMLFDSIIVGWGAYTHIKGREKRIQLLKDALSLLNPDGLLLISFWPWHQKYINLNRVYKIGSFVAKIVGNEKLEKGDVLRPFYGRYFQPGDAESEMQEAGFNVIYSYHEDFGVVLGQKL